MAHILDETQYADGRGDRIWRPLMSRAAYHGLRGHGGDDVSFRIEEVAIENIEGRQPEKSFTGVWDQIMDPAVPDDARNDLAFEAVTGMLDAFRVGAVRARRLVGRGAEGRRLVFARRLHADAAGRAPGSTVSS